MLKIIQIQLWSLCSDNRIQLNYNKCGESESFDQIFDSKCDLWRKFLDLPSYSLFIYLVAYCTFMRSHVGVTFKKALFL